MLLSLLGAVTLLLRSTVAVFADEAWNLDYHHPLLGLPKEETTFLHQPNPNSKASLIYTLSEQGVIGAVNPRDGLLVWRQPLVDSPIASNASFLRAGEGQDIVISGYGSQIAAWSAADGRLAWSTQVQGQLKDLEVLELSDGNVTPGAKDAIVLTEGDQATVQRVDGASGAFKWKYAIESGDAPYQVSISSTKVFAILLHKTLLGHIKIKVISLDPVSGRKTDEYILSSEGELACADTIVSVGANSASPIIAWTDATNSVLKINVIGTKAISLFKIETHNGSGVKRVRLHAPYRTNAQAHFLVHYETVSSHWGEVFHIDLEHGKVEKAYQLPKLAGKGAFSTSTTDANVYFTRVTSSEIITMSSASHGVLGRWTVGGFGVVAGPGEEREPIHAVSEVSVKQDYVSALRSVVLLSSGEWVLLREGNPIWQRPEVLASTVSATFARPAEVEAFAHDLNIEAHSNPVQAYLHRVTRHIGDLQRLPEVLASLPKRINSGLFGTTAEDELTSDTFGFHQVIACATANGRVVALDASNPNKILWNRKLATLETGRSWDATFESAADGVIVLSHSNKALQMKLNASTGENVQSTPHSSNYASLASDVQFTLRNGGLDATRAGSEQSPLWQFFPSKGERIVSLVPRPINDPVASIGKVLGDRRVLYKYLSPNLALLVTANDASSTASFYVLDTVSGVTLFSSVHEGVELEGPISSIMSENWFVYSYTAQASEESLKGHQLVVGEMFESLVSNDRGPLSAKTNYSSLQTDAEPFVLTKTYQIPEAISKLSVTQTRQGITSRQVLAVLADSSSIVGIPYPVLDPRRPVNRDPTKDEMAEGLVRYTPTIEFDPKWYLNHQREVVGIKDIITSPALIESTSLVFAYGLDVFGTKVTPSFGFDILGKDFNKFQMLATVAALAVATFVVAPLVARKQINARWAL